MNKERAVQLAEKQAKEIITQVLDVFVTIYHFTIV